MVSWSSEAWYAQEQAIAKANGIPVAIVDAVIQMESGGKSVTNSIGAAGLLQLLPNGGQGSGYSNSQLLDPVTNLTIGIPYLANGYRKSGPFQNTYTWWYNFGLNSGHVGVAGSEQAAAATAMQNAYNAAGGGENNNTTSTAAAQKVVNWFKSFTQTQGYGVNNEYGVDLGTPYHTSVPAMYAGKVLWAGQTNWGSDLGSSGGLVAIDTMVNGVRQVFYVMHLDTVNVKAGDTVNIGDTLGLSGGQTTGGSMPTSSQYSTGPHTEMGFNANALLNSGNVKVGTLTAGFNPVADLTNVSYIAASGAGGGNNPGGTTPGSPSGFDPTGISGLTSAITNMPANLLNTMTSSDVIQRGTLIFIALIIVLIGVLVLFFSSGGGQTAAKVAAATA